MKNRRDYRDDERVKNLSDFRWFLTEMTGIATLQIRGCDYQGNVITTGIVIICWIVLAFMTGVTWLVGWVLYLLMIHYTKGMCIMFGSIGVMGLASYLFYKLSMGADKIGQLAKQLSDKTDKTLKTDKTEDQI